MSRCLGKHRIVPLGIVLLLTTAAAQAEKVYTVTASAEARTPRQARERAMGKALDAIVDAYLSDVAVTSEQKWFKRLLSANAPYVIGNYYRVISIHDGANNDLTGLSGATVEVSLPASRLEAVCGEVAGFLENVKQPTVMLLFTDRIEDRRIPGVRIQKDSDVAQAVMARLQDEGFRVIIRRQSEIIQQNKVEMAELRGDDLRAVKALAQKQGAHIFVWGLGRTQGPLGDQNSIPGRQLWTWAGDAKSEVYWTDDARLIATRRANAESVHRNADHAAVLCLQKVGDRLADELIPSIFEDLLKQAIEGRPVTIEILNCTDDEADAVEESLSQALGPDAVLDSNFSNGVGTIRLLSKTPANELRKQVKSLPVSGFRLETYENGSNSLQFTVKH